ncbi:MAG: response regulator [Saprospiraceae bacterium]|nr:response regulator [Saprospiraceae bacterium]
MKLGYIIGLWLVLLAFTLKAQFSNKVHFRNISVKDGLSYPVINCILQDQKGFIWIGTQVGLNKYDSQKFKVYYANPDQPGSLSDDYISCLFEDAQERLWVGTMHGLNVYQSKTSTFKKIEDELLNDKRILAITGDQLGNNWVLTRQYLVAVNTNLKIVRKYYVGEIATDKTIHSFSTVNIDQKGNLWVVTNRGLRLFDPVAQKLSNPLQDEVASLQGNIEFVSTIFFDKKGRTWVAGRGNGLRFYDPQVKQWKEVEKLSSKFINGIIEDENDQIWICTGRNGLNFYDSETGEVEVIRYAEKPESNFVSNSLSCMYSDRQGGIWIGTFNNGLQYYFQHQLKFNLYYSEGQISGLKTNYITSFAVNHADNIWIGAGEEGLLFFDRKNKTFKSVRPNPAEIRQYGDLKENFYVFSLLLTEDEEHLFIGTLTGIYDYQITKNKWTYYHQQQGDADTRSEGFVISLVQDGDNIYMANYKGVAVYNFHTGVIRQIDPPLPQFRGLALAQTDSIIFVGTRFHGLWQLHKASGKLEKVAAEDSVVELPEFVRSLALDRNNRLLIGTESEGLYRCNLDFKKIEKLSSNFQNRKLAFMALCEDPRSGYWIATNQGLARINERLEIQKMFDQGEGIEPAYFQNGALLKSPTNEILMGGNTGIYSFFPNDFFSPATVEASIHLTDFLLLNKSVLESEVEGFKIRGDLDDNQTIRLPKYLNLLTFEYAALDFHNPSRVNYAYRLEPYEKDWNNVGNRRFATYRDLPAGTYTFKVKAQNANEKLTSEIASLKVIIPPKPWLTWWAYLIYATIVFLVYRQLYLYRKNRRKLRQEIAMQKFQQEKMEELYNFKIDFFTQVTHELRTPLTLIIGPLEELIHRNNFSKDNNLLKLIHRNTQKLLRTVNQILDFRKLENSEMKVFAKKGNIVAFAEEIFYSFLGNAEQKGIELHFETNMETYPYVLFDKDIMEKILVNLIANAVKFTQNGQIELTIYEAQNQSASSQYYIKISDTGRGIKPENIDKIFDSFFQEKRENHVVGSGLGLKMVKELTNLHHGSIEVSSVVDAGTTFLLSFPKADLELMDEEPAKPSISQPTEQPSQLKETEQNAVKEATAKILIVDDEAEIRGFLENVFDSQYEVFSSDSAQKAIDLAKSEMPDIIISDVMMPEMDGYQLCEYTKTDFLLRHIPVVLLTALKTTEHEIEGLKTGADAYISKPFSVELLKATVQNLLSSRQKLKQAFLNSSVNDAGILTQDNSDQEFIEKLISLIEEKIDEANLETAHLANQLGMSSSTFYRKLKSLAGLSGNEFIRTVRLKRSVDYLKSTSLNVSEVAYRVGFSDPKYFATCFKKLYHLTPSEFAEQHRKY